MAEGSENTGEPRGARRASGAWRLEVGGRTSPAEKAGTARRLRAEWDAKWTAPPPARWADRPVPAEVVAAVDSGWFAPTGTMLEPGCGTAEIAAWFAARGYRATGVDIAQAALDRAAERHAGLLGPLELVAADLCTQTLASRSFDVIVDRGCLHQIPRNLVADYIRNLAALAAPGARMLLFTKAFRKGVPFADPDEAQMRSDWVARVFAGRFELERSEPTHLNPGSAETLPGMAFWLIRTE